MSTPTTCPFCGAALRPDWNFECGSGPAWSILRSTVCLESEVARLTKERDESRKLDVQATQHCVDVMNERDAALVRIKRLEVAGDSLNGDVQALRAILADMGARGTIGNASMEGWKKAKEAT